MALYVLKSKDGKIDKSTERQMSWIQAQRLNAFIKNGSEWILFTTQAEKKEPEKPVSPPTPIVGGVSSKDMQPTAVKTATTTIAPAVEFPLKNMNSNLPLQILNIIKTYPINRNRVIIALNRVSISLPPGEIYGCLGPNGAGKTTMIKVILNFIRPDSGTVAVYGKSPEDYTSRASIGYVPEDYGFYEFMTGRAMIEVFARLKGIPKEMFSREIDRVLQELQLTDDADKKIRTYSKGIRQRLAIAQALLGEPHLLILDEPSNSLDPFGIAQLRGVLQRFKEQNKSVFLCSHLLTEVEKIADRVGILVKGNLVAELSVAEITKTIDLETFFMEKVQNAR